MKPLGHLIKRAQRLENAADIGAGLYFGALQNLVFVPKRLHRTYGL